MGHQAPSGEGSGRILLIGDIRRAFLDAQRVDRYPCDVRPGFLEGIEAAAKGRYDAVGVVVDGLRGRFAAALRALRRGTSSPVLLLVSMYEEPLALSLINDGPDRPRLADRYLVCPTTLSSLCAVAEGPPSGLDARIRHLEWLATTDDLTGLKNRRYLWEFTRQILDRARQNGGQVTLLVFDIDNFKHYNDVYGHPAGDEILRQAALLMRRCCRPHDVVGRIGGDEFAVVFWDDPHRVKTGSGQERRSRNSDHPTEAIFIAKRFQEAFGRSELHLLGPGGEGVLTISGGLASFPRDGQTADNLFARADAALLDAKRSGKNRLYLVGLPQNDVADKSRVTGRR